MYLKFFKDISKKSVDIAGGKGASLGEMTKAGIPVPPGFVILSSAFEQFIADTDVNVEIDASLDRVNHQDMNSVENASETIQAVIMKAQMPKSIAIEITAAFKKLKSPFVAVRSSATAEDGATSAWAGQLDTYLNTTDTTLKKNVQRCWASLFTPRAIFYRFEKNLHKEKISVAVVVQKMVQSESAGVAFSVHPVTQDRNQMIIEAGWGLGEAVVSGQITPDSYVIDKRDWTLLDVNVSEQEKELVTKGKRACVESDSGNAENVRAGRQKIIELAKLVVHIEKHYGFPCDVEWAREKKKFHITQSRPITTL